MYISYRQSYFYKVQISLKGSFDVFLCVCLESGHHQEYYAFSKNEYITIKANWLSLFKKKETKRAKCVDISTPPPPKSVVKTRHIYL